MTLMSRMFLFLPLLMISWYLKYSFTVRQYHSPIPWGRMTSPPAIYTGSWMSCKVEQPAGVTSLTGLKYNRWTPAGSLDSP